MAVRADELALLDLRQDPRAATPVDHGAHLGELPRAGLVVPVHRSRMEHPAALGARLIFLQTSEPVDLGRTSIPGLGNTQLSPLSVVAGVVEPSTGFAPRLVCRAPPMERVEWFHLATRATPLHRPTLPTRPDRTRFERSDAIGRVGEPAEAGSPSRPARSSKRAGGRWRFARR